MQEARRHRVRSIESRLRTGVLLPLAAVVAVWLAVSGYLGYGAYTQYWAATDTEQVLSPTAVALTAVMDERSATAAYLERPEESRDALRDARSASDEHVSDVLDTLENGMTSPTYSEAVNDRIDQLQREFDSIQHVRDSVDRGDASRPEVLDYYNSLSAAGADLFEEQARANPSQDAVSAGMSAVEAFRAVDTLSRADAQLARGFATDEFSAADQAEFTRLVGVYRASVGAVDQFMGPTPQRTLDDLRGGTHWSELTELEETITQRTVDTTTDPDTGESEENLATPVSEAEWHAAYTPVKETLGGLGIEQALWYAEIQQTQATWSIALAVGGSAGIFLLGAGALMYTTRSARTTVARLHRLRDETRDLTEHGLPEVLARVRDGQGEPVHTEALRVSGEDEDDEIGQVARSFNAAHHTAVNAAIRQVEMRQGVNRVFLNIAHRSQTLIHRQLKLLDRMERDQEDPSQLTDLFKLDHLATRSRRNAENLLILGGETPGRTWHRPMPLIDVLRGAISESGDYTRVRRQNVAHVSVMGPAVADVIHLVAELVDNATTFSPPHTQVTLNSVRVANGVTIEVEDRGLGMRESEFDAVNALLATPPEFDVMRLNEQTRLGLFVVSHLAHRHDISVRLRGSPYGGTQAIVLLPPDITVTDAPPLPHSTDADDAVEVSEVSTGDDSRALTGGAAPALPTRDASNGHAPAERPLPGASENSEYTASGLPKRVRSTAPSGDPADGPAPPPAPEPTGPRPSLPKRTPQANLAPQLYDPPSGPPHTPADTDPEEGADQDRSDRLRRNMAAFQHGTQRGRLEGRHRTTDTEKDSRP